MTIPTALPVAAQSLQPLVATPKAAAPVAAPEPLPVAVADTFVPSASGTVGDKIKSGLLIGSVMAVGGALGVYAGLCTGILPGLAGTIAGASGGVAIATALPSTPIKVGALAGAIAGTLVGATVGNPVAAVALGLAGAAIPYSVLVGVMSGAS